jgi:hypothetical protein
MPLIAEPKQVHSGAAARRKTSPRLFFVCVKGTKQKHGKIAAGKQVQSIRKGSCLCRRLLLPVGVAGASVSL